jgi:hypothetical protein
MKDWSAVAAGFGLNIPEADLDRIRPALDALEGSFRPLAGRIPLDIEPAVRFSLESDRVEEQSA